MADKKVTGGMDAATLEQFRKFQEFQQMQKAASAGRFRPGGHHTGQSGGDTCLRAGQVDLGILGSGTTGEIAVERANRNLSGTGRLTHADARSASRFQDSGPRRDDFAQGTVFRDRLEDLLRSGSYGAGNGRIDLFPFEHCCGRH